MTKTSSTPAPSKNGSVADDWNDQFAQLKARYPKVRDPILVALHVLTQNPSIELDDAKAQAALHGCRITAASVSAAQRLLSRQDAPQAAAAPTTPKDVARPPEGTRRPRKAAAPVDIEHVVREAVTRISATGAAEADRLRAAMRKAMEALSAALEA